MADSVWDSFADAPAPKEDSWASFADAPSSAKAPAFTSGEKQFEADKALIAKEAGMTPEALKAGLYSAANVAGMNVPSHAVAAYTSLSQNKPYWEAYKEQKEYEQALERQNPTASKIGTGVGFVGGLAVPLGPAAKIATYGAKAAAPI